MKWTDDDYIENVPILHMLISEWIEEAYHRIIEELTYDLLMNFQKQFPEKCKENEKEFLILKNQLIPESL